MLAANQKEELAVFCDRARHSGNIGLDDIGGDAGNLPSAIRKCSLWL